MNSHFYGPVDINADGGRRPGWGNGPLLGGGPVFGCWIASEEPRKAITCRRRGPAPAVLAASMLPVSGCVCLGRSE